MNCTRRNWIVLSTNKIFFTHSAFVSPNPPGEGVLADLLDNGRVRFGGRGLAALEGALDGVELVLDLLELEVLERRELQLAHQLHTVHAHERVHHDQLGRGRSKSQESF